MPVLETALAGFVAGAAGRLGSEAAVRGVMLAERKFSEIQKSAEVLRAGETGRDVPSETLIAQAEALLLDQEALNRQFVREASPFSDGVTARIRNPDEVNVYKDAGIGDATVNGRFCLTKSDIDPVRKDDFGRTNAERMQKGLSPLDAAGKPYELHHIGQEHDAPLAELTYDEHRGNYSVLHERCESSIDRAAFTTERANHWKSRAAQLAALSNG